MNRIKLFSAWFNQPNGIRRRRLKFPGTIQVAESLEQRRMLTQTVHSFYPDDTGPQNGALLGQRVAVSSSYRVVAATGTSFSNTERLTTNTTRTGGVYVYDSSDSLLHTLTANTSAGGFGDSIDLSANVIAVGHTGFSVPFANGSGQVTLFNAVSGTEVRSIENPEPGFLAGFGTSVAISSDLLVVGTDRDSVFVFDRNDNYQQLAKLTVPSPDSEIDCGGGGCGFGHAVAVENGHVLVGAPGSNADVDSNGNPIVGTGRAYVFESDGTLVSTMANPNPQELANFGASVGLSNGVAAVGAPGDDTHGNGAGLAYLIDSATGEVNRTLVDPVPADGDRFGSSVAIHQDSTVVGGWSNNDSPAGVGAVFAFDVATGNATSTYSNPSDNFGEFGTDVATDGNTVLVGAPRHDRGAQNAGQAYTFASGSGNLKTTLLNATPPADDLFGSSVSIADQYVVVGSPQDDGELEDSGKIRIIDLDSPDGPEHRIFSDPSPAKDEKFGDTTAASGTIVAASSTVSGVVHVFDAEVAFDETNPANPLVASFSNPDPNVNDVFGSAIAVAGSRVIVGSSKSDDSGQNNGQVYVFDSDNPESSVRRLNVDVTASNHQAGFGYSVAATESTIVVGAPGDDSDETNAGRVYAFNTVSGALLGSFSHPDPERDDQFGMSVAVDGNVIIVGTPRDDNGTGSVQVYRTDGTVLAPLEIPAADRNSSTGFGTSVSLWRQFAVVGAASPNGATDRTGRAYVYDVLTGELLDQIDNPTSQTFSDFASAISVFNNRVVVGSSGENTRGDDQGAAFVFNVNNRPTDVHFNTNAAVDENLAAGSIVKTLRTVDIDSWDEHSYELVAGNGDTDNAAFDVLGDGLQMLDSPDFEAQSVFNIRLRTTDSGGLTFEKQLSLTIADVNETPESLGLTSQSITENQPVGTRVGELVASDPEDDPVTFRLVDGEGDDDNDLFVVDGSDLKSNALFNAADGDTYSIRVRASDPEQLFVERTFEIRIEKSTGAIQVVDRVLEIVGTTDGDTITLERTSDDVTITMNDEEWTFSNNTFDSWDVDLLDGDDLLLAAEVVKPMKVYGREGNDTVLSGSSDDLVYGDDGDDSLIGGSGDDTIAGNAGDDTIRGNDGHDEVDAGLGDDSAIGGSGNDFIVGGDGKDTLGGSVDDDTVIGGEGDDELGGGSGDDSVRGESGNDSITGEEGDDTLLGGVGQDSIFAASGRDSLDGGAGNDVVFGGGNPDTLVGSGGHDKLFGRGGADIVLGNGGDDSIVGGGGTDTLYGNSGADTLKGGRFADAIVGGPGDDSLNGGDQRDLLIGSDGADSLNGNGQNDILVAGVVTWEDESGRLADVMAEWDSTRTFVERVANLRDGSGTSPANGTTFLSDDTVSDDNFVDQLTGEGAKDWFFADLDEILDLASNELID